MTKIFIGYDPREIVAYNVLAYSISSLSSQPVSITPLMLSQLKDILPRKREPLQSTEFSISRFLIPYLCDYKGWAIFMDCDMLLQDDIAKLWAMKDESKAVMVVKHDYIPKDDTKFFGLTQAKYEKKNWSSLMLINNEKCKALTLDYVNTASGLELHQFKWLKNENEIGELPKKWNFLVQEYSSKNIVPSLLHYTIGGPYFSEYRNCEFSANWMEMLKKLLDSDGLTICP